MQHIRHSDTETRRRNCIRLGECVSGSDGCLNIISFSRRSSSLFNVRLRMGFYKNIFFFPQLSADIFLSEELLLYV